MKKILLLTSIFSLNMLMASQASKSNPKLVAKRINKLEKTLEATLAKATKLESELQSLQESIVSEGEALEEVLGSAEAAKLTAKKTTLKPYQSKSTPTPGAINTAKRKAAAAALRAAAEGEEY